MKDSFVRRVNVDSSTLSSNRPRSIRPSPDGSLRITPHPVAEGTIMFSDLSYRDHTIDVTIAADRCQVTVDGHIGLPDAGGTFIALPPTSAR